MKLIGAYRVLSDSTLKSFSKESLIDIIRILEHNWKCAEECCENQAKFLDRLVSSLPKEKSRGVSPALSENYRNLS